jgi:predicted DsbA family dithiol-disulfide isomerase
MQTLTLVYYLDVLSSWCFVAERSLGVVRERLGERLKLDWRLAFLFNGGPMAYSPQLAAWQYRRNESLTGVKLNARWRESANDTTWWANLATEAARTLGVTDDRVRHAIARAAMADGVRVGARDEAVKVAVTASGLDRRDLEREMDHPRTAERLWESTMEYKSLPVRVQPTFIFRNEIGDTAILSGLVGTAPLNACADEMLAAAEGYAKFNAENVAPP